MAKFIGSQEEFLGFFSGFLRNKVQGMSRNYRLSATRCVACKKEEKLEYAHLQGNGRVEISKRILDKYTKDNVVTIDLSDFEAQFEQLHFPIEEHGLMLCRQCHRKYDSGRLSYVDFVPDVTLPTPTADEDAEKERTKEQELLRKINTIGKETFVKYYEVFRANMNERSNAEIKDAFSGEDWNDSSKNTKAAQGKQIFLLGLEKEALSIIAKAKRLNDSVIKQAENIENRK